MRDLSHLKNLGVGEKEGDIKMDFEERGLVICLLDRASTW